MDRIEAAKLTLETNALQLENIRLTIEVLKGNAQPLLEVQPSLMAELKAAQEEKAAADKKAADEAEAAKNPPAPVAEPAPAPAADLPALPAAE